MRKNIKIFVLSLLLMTAGMISSCDKGFEELNKDIDLVTEPNLDYVLPFVELTMNDNTYYTIVDYIAAVSFQVNRRRDFQTLIKPGDTYHAHHFEWIYENSLKSVVDLIAHAKEDPEKVNYLNIARILKVYIVHQLTDTYGDIPYFQAGQGYAERIFTPEYDSQQAIYADLFKELEEATLALDESKPVPTSADIIYGGDLAKWRKFANSLMLRLGLRIMDVDPENGKKWIDKAIAGGLLESNDDNFVVYYLPNSDAATTSNPTSNGPAKVWIKYDTYYLSEPFVAELRDKNDPRTSVYCQLRGDGDKTPANQLGFVPLGYVSVPDKGVYSKANMETFGRYDAPSVLLSYAQVQFQLAECVVRNIVSTGDAKAYYESGVRAAMDELKVFGPEGIVSDDQATAYLAANPYNPADNEKALEMINTQYWIETFSNWYETFANMRRSGYPELYSKIDPSIEGNEKAELPGRATYPSGEVAINPKVQDAIQRQGPDLARTHVWWDVE